MNAFKSTFVVLCLVLIVLLVALIRNPESSVVALPIGLVCLLLVLLPFAPKIKKAVLGKNGVTLELEERVGVIEEQTATLLAKQREQDEFLNQYRFFSILANLLSQEEKHHAKYLYRREKNASSEKYMGRDSLRYEMFRLKRFGLLIEQAGQNIGLMYDKDEFDPIAFVRLTDLGKSFVEQLPKIES